MTILASTYDSHGLMTPATINMKQFLQQLWKKEMDWDDPLNDTEAEAAIQRSY